MDDCWHVLNRSQILEQSSVSEYSLPPLHCVTEDGGTTAVTATKRSRRRRAMSFSDSVSSDFALRLDPTMECYSLKRWVESDNDAETPCGSNNDIAANKTESANYPSRTTEAVCRCSWDGSPDWDFKEGCSYDVHNRRTPDVMYLKQLRRAEEPCEFIPLSKMNPYHHSVAMLNCLDETAFGKTSMDCTRCGEFSLLDSARDVQLMHLEDAQWDSSDPFSSSSLYSSFPSNASRASLPMSREGGRYSLDNCVRDGDGSSFLNRVRNEIDFELLEGNELEYNADPSLDAVSIVDSHGSSDDESERHPQSTIGRVLSLVVGIGAGAMFQIMK